jgi:hypothetical protein
MLTGRLAFSRFITGIGGESLVSWVQEVCTRWFGGTPYESKSMGDMVMAKQIMIL